jgi:hypothetical protein
MPREEVEIHEEDRGDGYSSRRSQQSHQMGGRVSGNRDYCRFIRSHARRSSMGRHSLSPTGTSKKIFTLT